MNRREPMQSGATTGRRGFLGAAAVAAGVPLGTIDQPDRSGPVVGYELEDEYREIHRDGLWGWYNAYEETSDDVNLRVTSVAEFVDGSWEPRIYLRLTTGRAEIGTELTPRHAVVLEAALKRGRTRRFSLEGEE